MKLKINKENQKLVKNFKKIVIKNREIEDRLFAALASKMMLTASEEELLFDHVYNDTNWTVELEK
ncbi:MAG TPA: hypothetical protein VIO63_05070 [Candidatus Nanopelagicaceae bacterium]|jgi:hypothetical protein